MEGDIEWSCIIEVAGRPAPTLISALQLTSYAIRLLPPARHYCLQTWCHLRPLPAGSGSQISEE